MKDKIKNLLSKLEKGNRKKVAVRLLTCFVILGIGLIAFLILGSIKPKPKQKNSDRLIKTLITIPVKKESIKEVVVGYGTAEPVQRIAVSSPIDGKIVYVMPNLKNGVLVTKGTILAKIEKNDYQIALKRAIANIDSNNAELAIQKQGIKDNKEILKILEIKLQLSEADYNRQAQLFKKKAVSAQLFERAEQARIEVHQTYLKMKRDISKAELGLNSIIANTEIAETEKMRAELDLERCDIKSPITGRLENVNIEKNEYIVKLKAQPLFEVVDDSSLLISVSLDTREAATILDLVPEKTNNYKHWFKYDQNTSVLIRWTEEPNMCVWEGKISRIEKFDPETRTVTVVVTPTKFIGKSTNRLPLVAGMYCQVSFTGKELKNVVKIPWSALQLNGHVYVVDKNNVVHEKEVNIKSSRQDQVIISSGLDAGEKIINQRIPYGVVNGSKVKTVIVNNK